ncbi:alpha/beta hydrolase [SAR202 cluster bacterium AD-804-J14_MRT_500m]|nr:alpha/beta hydrolase [SAR202 cluster bacterium AD-804-J14_MRT_500m]
MIRRGYADTPEGQVHYRIDGEGDPVVLLHQTPRSSRMYSDLIPILARQFRVIAIDMLGYGSSDAPPAGASMADMATNVVNFMDALDIGRCHLFGLHTGAGVSAKAVAEYPERFQSLILFGFPLIEESSERDAYFASKHDSSLPVDVSPDGAHVTALWMRAYSEIIRLWLHTAGAPSEVLSPHPLKSVHTFLSDHHLRFLDRWLLDFMQTRDGVKQITSSLFQYDFLPVLQSIHVPTLHIEPDSPYENYFCRRGNRVAELIPMCDNVMLDYSDDNAAEFKPTELADVMLAFLGKNPM